MPLIYALVARGKVVLAEYSESEGNFPTVTRLLLCRFPTREKQRMSYIYDRYVFHYVVVQELTFLCMSDEAVGFALPFAFLEELSKRFIQAYGETAQHAIALAMQNSFGPSIQELMNECNSNPAIDNLSRIRAQIDGIHNIMIENIDRILERGERIDLLVDCTEQLNQESVKFRRQAGRLKRTMWWRNIRIGILFIFLVASVIVLIAMTSCGGVTFPKCRRQDEFPLQRL